MKIKKKTTFYHLVCISYLLELFVPAISIFSEFKFEWPYICCIILFVDCFVHYKYEEYRVLFRDYLQFFIWCIILLVIGYFRFQSNMLFIGAAHTFRMLLLFAPFFWILLYLNNKDRYDFYMILRKYLLISVMVLFAMGLIRGGISNSTPLGTVGVSKNSLGYTILCIQILYSVFEKTDYLYKPYKPAIWNALCILVCLFTKSGTAVTFSFAVFALYFIKNIRINILGKIAVVAVSIVFVVAFLNTDILIALFRRLHVDKLSEFFYSIFHSGGVTLGRTTDVRLTVQRQVLQDFDLEMALGRFYYYYYAIHGFTAHQLYLQVLYDTGVLGLFLFVKFCVRSIIKSKKYIAVVVIFLYSMIEVFLIQYASLIILALIVAFKYDELKEQEHEDENCNSCPIYV